MDKAFKSIKFWFWPSYLLLFSRESDSTITNVCSFVRSFVRPSVCKTPQQLEIIILHPSSFFIHPSSSFIILHSSYIILHSFLLHFATFKLFSLFRKHCSTNKSTIPHRTNMYTNANYYALKVENKIIIQVSLKQNHKKSSGREKTYHQIQCRGPLV